MAATISRGRVAYVAVAQAESGERARGALREGRARGGKEYGKEFSARVRAGIRAGANGAGRA